MSFALCNFVKGTFLQLEPVVGVCHSFYLVIAPLVFQSLAFRATSLSQALSLILPASHIIVSQTPLIWSPVTPLLSCQLLLLVHTAVGLFFLRTI